MLDTVTLRYKLSSSNVAWIIERLLSMVPENPPAEILELYAPYKHRWLNERYNSIHNFCIERFFGYVRRGEAAPYLFLENYHIPSMNPGIKSIYIYRGKIGNYYTDDYFIAITISPEMLIQNKRTVALYQPSSINNIVLQDSYAAAIFFLFPEVFRVNDDSTTANNRPDDLALLPYIAGGKVASIALTLDTRPEDLCLTKKLIKASTVDHSLNKAELENDNTYIRTKSKVTTICFYDKVEKFNKDGIIDPTLLEEAHSILRFEATKRRPVKEWIENNFHVDLTDCPYNLGLLPFLNNYWLDYTMYGYYNKFLGQNDWYSDKAAVTMVDKSSLSTRAKNELKSKTLPAISQARSVEAARNNCTSENGYTLNIGRNVHFSENSFNKQLKNACLAGIQPFRIPRNWATEHNVWRNVENPIKKAVPPGQEHSLDDSLLSGLSDEEMQQYRQTVEYYNSEYQRRKR